VAGLFGGVPICHGSGGLTAHYRLGAKTGGAGLFLGTVLLILALGFGPAILGFCQVIPRPVLGALLVYVGAAHCLLVRDVVGRWAWAVVIVTGGLAGITNHPEYGLAAGLAILAFKWLADRALASKPTEKGST
jgi:MFS superfamily sulfate permease-like transporter